MRSVGYSVLVEVRSGLELELALSSPPRLALVVSILAAVSQTSFPQVLSNVPSLVETQQNSHDDLLVHMVSDAPVFEVVGMGDILERWSTFVVTARIMMTLGEGEEQKLSQGRHNVREVRVQLEVVLPASRRWTCCLLHYSVVDLVVAEMGVRGSTGRL